jgi:hypothetical protein
MFFSRLLNSTKTLTVTVLILSAVNCVYIPYPVPADVKYIENASFPEDALLSLGPRDLLADIAESITEIGDNIEVVDGEQFRDTAFPEGNWTLHNMLKPETCFRINEDLDVDYLVLVSTKGVIVDEEEGFIIPLLVGVMTVDKEMTVDAILLDLKTAKSVCRISSKAHGTEKMFYWVIVIVATGPFTDSSAITGLGEEIVNVIEKDAGSDKVRVAIMALETIDIEAIEQ